MSRYKEVAEIVFKYREHRDRLVRRSITALLPRIANFLRDRFISSYLKVSWTTGLVYPDGTSCRFTDNYAT